MKKILLCILLLAAVQNWGRISSYFSPPSPVATDIEAPVVMFGTAWCGYCAEARTLFQRAGVAYHEYDIEKSVEGFRQYQALGGRGVPLLIINGKVLRGFNRRQILRELSAD